VSIGRLGEHGGASRHRDHREHSGEHR
jgi:hypothetical protein